MVHRDIGSARITYPTGVKVSPVDPMTSANLPRELRMVPGVVSRPIRLSGPGQRNAKQLIANYLREARGDAVQAAALAGRDRLSDPSNLALRNAEHALFSRSVLQSLGPVLGRAVVATSVPLYSAAKAIGRPMGFFKEATAPSWQEVQYGLEPIVSPAPAPVEAAPAPVAPWPAGGLAVAIPCSWAPELTCTVYFGQAEYEAYIAGGGEVRGGGLAGVGYYPNLGQGPGEGPSYLPASISGLPTWVWWIGAGVLVLLVGGAIFGGRATPARPRVRTVTRTTF